LIRVRGIYSTAVTGLLDEAGYSFADVSIDIQERFPALKKHGEVLLTIKDQDDRSGLIILGDPELLAKVVFLLRSIIPDLIVGYVPVGPYSMYVVRLVERVDGDIWLAEYMPGRFCTVKLRNSHSEGDLLLAHVTRASPEAPLLKEGAALTGRYVRLIQFERHNTSEHIRDAELRLQLLTLAMNEVPQGWGVHFRSAAKNANILDVGREIKDLLKKATEFLNVFKPQSIGPVMVGESLALVEIPPDTALKFDTIRERYFTTIPFHHLLKSLGIEELSHKIDFAEKNVLSGRCFSREKVLEAIMEEFAKLHGSRVSIFHKKLTGQGHVWSAVAEIRSPGYVQLRRQSSSQGTYDGFKNIRREEGDQIVSYTWLFARTIIHFYYSPTGELKGIYVNLNTPVFFALQPPGLKYVDLAMDVTYSPMEGVQVTDQEDFQELVEYEILPRSLAEKYKLFAEKVAGILGEKNSEDIVAEARRLQSSIFGTEVDKML